MQTLRTEVETVFMTTSTDHELASPKILDKSNILRSPEIVKKRKPEDIFTWRRGRM